MTIASIIPSSNKVPGTYLKVSLGVGPRSSGASPRHVVIFGNKTSAGTIVAATETDCFSEDDARTLGGPRSELFWLAKAAITAYPGVRLKLMAVTEAGTAATGTAVFTGTATSAGTVGVTVLGEEVEVAVASGDTATVVGAAVATAVTNKADWPLTAANVTGTVTFTAANTGPRGNFLAVRARIIAGTGISVTPPSGGYLGSGATADDPQTALDAIAAVRRRYLVAPYSDATQLGKFKTHTDAEDEPLIGHRKQVIFGSLDTLGNATTLATGLNFSRMQCAWQEKSDLTPGMLAAGLAAQRAFQESVDTAHNYDGEVITGFRPHYAKADIPTSTELDSALNNGITPLSSSDAGDVFIVRSITTKSRDSGGLPDYRVLDTHKVAVSDEIADRFELGFADRFAGFKADNNPPEGEAPPPGVVTPAMCTDLAYEILNEAEDGDGLLASGSVEARKGEIIFELSTISQGRFNGVVPIDVIEHAHQFACDIRQIG
jgi:phage tail sheath gpL-like